MTKEREALKLALEALETSARNWPSDSVIEAITAIKEALAEQDSKDKEQAKTDSFVRQLDEALAQPWEKFCDSNCVWTDHHPDCKLAQPDQYAKGYADAMNWKVQNHLEHLPAAQPEQEPVAWCVYCDGQFNLNIFRVKDVADVKKVRLDLEYPNHKRKVVPLYTSPPQRKPLTDEEIILIVAECASSHQHTDIHFARAIEAAIWEKQK